MKVLRKNDDFRKMPEKDQRDLMAIDVLIKQGWNYCSKSTYKEYFGKNSNVENIELSENTKKVTKEKRKEKKKNK